MRYTNTESIKEYRLTTLETISTEVGKLIWKWGLFFLVLTCVVASRLFYEMIHNPLVSIRKLLALAGLGMSVGMVTIIWCALNGFGTWSVALIGISALASYRIVDHIVEMDIETLKTWLKGVLQNAINSLGKKHDDTNL